MTSIEVQNLLHMYDGNLIYILERFVILEKLASMVDREINDPSPNWDCLRNIMKELND